VCGQAKRQHGSRQAILTHLDLETNMKTKSFLLLALVLCVALPATNRAQDKETAKETAKEPATAFDRFKQLAGEWVGKGMHGDDSHDATIVYKVTSGGTAVVETIDPGGEHEMVTVIHPDGDALLLTHYCMLGNQPHLKAKPKAGDSKVAFEFVNATNLKSDKDMHMHDVTFTFVDKDTIKTEWTNFNDGKPAGKAVFELKRKK
jgi:hypothetical protein